MTVIDQTVADRFHRSQPLAPLVAVGHDVVVESGAFGDVIVVVTYRNDDILVDHRVVATAIEVHDGTACDLDIRRIDMGTPFAGEEHRVAVGLEVSSLVGTADA